MSLRNRRSGRQGGKMLKTVALESDTPGLSSGFASYWLCDLRGLP